MSKRRDRQRMLAIQAWFRHVGGIEAAHEITDISVRTLQRFQAGTQPPPVAVLESLAERERDAGAPELAAMLLRAAQPAGEPQNA